MGFEGLLGNERLKENLSRSLGRGRIAHFYVISGPAGSGKHTLARLLAAAMLCKEADKPCLRCSACRKVLSGNHPDFITVDDPDKKIVPVDLVRQARADIYVRPNEADRKIYLFPRGHNMELPSQNALLKVLEEPPEYGVFLLLTENAEKLLPTVRSRCMELPLLPLSEEILTAQLRSRFPQADEETIAAAIARSGGYLGQAAQVLEEGQTTSAQTEDFAAAFAASDSLALTLLLASMERWKRDQLIPVLQQWEALLQNALVCRSGIAATSSAARQLAAQRSSQELMHAIGQIQKAIAYAQGNVSEAAICGFLTWSLR
jgi:DNA polymerase-3 subunit delta'